MTSAILVGGMRGVGKSTLLDTYCERAICLEAEAIQDAAVKIAKGFDFHSPYEWDAWNDQLRSRAPELLQRAFEEMHPTLHDDGRPLLVVGALLVQEWFRNALVGVLRLRFARVRTIECFVIHLDAKTISAQIEWRGREHESAYVNDYARIEQERDGYWDMAGPEWQKVNSHEELHRLIEASISLSPERSATL